MGVQGEVDAMTGAEAVPRSNGELIFHEPWQARAFGVAVGIVQEQGLGWEAFRRHLIDEIAAWEGARGDRPGDAHDYYERWLAALERLVLERGMVSAEDIESAVRHVAAGDDHGHLH